MLKVDNLTFEVNEEGKTLSGGSYQFSGRRWRDACYNWT